MFAGARWTLAPASSLSLIVKLFRDDYAGLWFGVKFHFLTVLDAFALPSTASD
jgi:hypothetical protein